MLWDEVPAAAGNMLEGSSTAQVRLPNKIAETAANTKAVNLTTDSNVIRAITGMHSPGKVGSPQRLPDQLPKATELSLQFYCYIPEIFLQPIDCHEFATRQQPLKLKYQRGSTLTGAADRSQ